MRVLAWRPAHHCVCRWQPVYFEKDTSFKHQITVMRHTDVLIGVHGSGLNNAMFMEPGSVVIAIMPSNYVEYVGLPPRVRLLRGSSAACRGRYEWHNFITGSGSTYLFQPTPDNKGHVDPKCNYNKKCDTLRPFQAKSVRLLTVPAALATLTRVSQSECLKMWYCDTRVDVGVTELLFRQTNFLIRNMKRELTKSKHAMPFNGGRNPAGRVAKLDD